jgi:predicted homoserine dehydrogenase-like protein
MFGLTEELAGLAARGQTIRAGLIGAGQMGTDIIAQVALMPSTQIVITADIALERALKAYEIAGHSPERVAAAHSLEEANQALLSGQLVATSDYRLVTDSTQVQVVIEATGSPEAGARATLRAIHQRKHLVNMSVEMDITIGPLANWYARQHDVVYTLAAGDEPAALYELYDFATALGLTVVAAGKGKNNPLDRAATPDSLAQEAARRGLTPEMLVEFVDGSKTMIEMAAVANATGLAPDVRGMHGPKANVRELGHVFALREEGGVLSRRGVVDYVIGDLAPGVFLVFTTDSPRLRQCLVLRDMGRGPNYVLLRPYHLCSMEVPLSVAQAALRHKSTMAPGKRLVAEVLTVAKRDLAPGTRLERIGGRTHYGLAERAEVAAGLGAVPLGIAQGATVQRVVPQGEVVTYDDVELLANSAVITLRQLQDAWLAGEIAEEALKAQLDALAAR